jgi:hypothetical protein
VTGVRLPTRVGYPMPVVVGALVTPKVPLFVVRHRSGFARGRVRADAAGPDDGPGRRRAGSADGVWKIAHRIVTDDWSMWADCTEKGGSPRHPHGSGVGGLHLVHRLGSRPYSTEATRAHQ